MHDADDITRSRFGSRAHALYVVLIAFGIERLVEGAYGVWVSPKGPVDFKHPANVMVLLAVVSWGARLFWSATNIERYGERADIPTGTRTTRIIAIHFPILLGQSAVFFWVCESYRTTVVPLLTGQPHPAGTTEQFALLLIISLVYNAAWLGTLVWPMARPGAPEVKWMANNTLFAALIGLSAGVMSQIPVPDPSYSIFVFGLLLLLNSAVDFRMTGQVYLES